MKGKTLTIEEAERKIRAVKALAEQGSPGERENAQMLLKRLCDKYNIAEGDLEEEKKLLRWFRYSQDIEKRLLCQIIYMITGKLTWNCKGIRKKKLVGVECSIAESIEIESNYKFYLNALKKELDIFMDAFSNKNMLFPSADIDTYKPNKEIDKERVNKMSLMMEGMERHIKHKAIEGKK